MNIQQYKKLKDNEIEAMMAIGTQYVSPKTLFKKTEFKDLTEEEDCWKKAIELGWRFDSRTGKFYRIIGY